MERAYSMASQQIQFYQYRPESDARHNAVFTPMPTEQPTYSPMAGYPHPHPHMPYPAPQYWHPPQFHHAHYVQPRVMSQTASPPLTLSMPMPKIMIDHQTNHMEHFLEHRYSSPPTPSLSACPSTVSSPPASSTNVTPVHAPGYFHLPLESSKEQPALTLPLMEEWSESAGELLCCFVEVQC